MEPEVDPIAEGASCETSRKVDLAALVYRPGHCVVTDIEHSNAVACWVCKACRIVIRVRVAVEARRLINLPRHRILRGEPPNLGIVEPRLGVVEVRLLVEQVAGEAEAVRGRRKLGRNAVAAPGVEVVAGHDGAG